MTIVRWTQLFDHRQGAHVTVTDVLDPVHGASRIGYACSEADALAITARARRLMNKPTLEIVQ